MRIQVKDFMITSVVTASVDKTIEEIRALMDYHGISSVPIIEYSKQLPESNVSIRGIITASDLNKNFAKNTPIENFMTKTVHVILPDSSAQAAAKMMTKHSVHHIVVMEEGKIVGIISSADFVKLVAEHNLD